MERHIYILPSKFYSSKYIPVTLPFLAPIVAYFIIVVVIYKIELESRKRYNIGTLNIPASSNFLSLNATAAYEFEVSVELPIQQW